MLRKYEGNIVGFMMCPKCLSFDALNQEQIWTILTSLGCGCRVCGRFDPIDDSSRGKLLKIYNEMVEGGNEDV